MSKPYFIVYSVLLCLTLYVYAHASSLIEQAEKKPVVITSETLTADNKNNTAVFEGSVIAKTDDIEMRSDVMTVYYDESENKIKRIHAVGNVKVHNKERALFSKEAMYIDEEIKITFTGNPKAIEGENVITGSQIIYYFKEDRAVVKDSRVTLQNTQKGK